MSVALASGAVAVTQLVTVAIAAAEPYVAAVQIAAACAGVVDQVRDRIEERKERGASE